MLKEDYFYSRDASHYNYEMMYQNGTSFSKYNNSSTLKSTSKHFLGLSLTDPLSEKGVTITNYTADFKNGDTCIYNAVNYIYDGVSWQKLANDDKLANEIVIDNSFKETKNKQSTSLIEPEGKQNISTYKVALNKSFDSSGGEQLESPKETKVVQGLPGIDGKSAYEIALEEGFSGTKTEWINSLKGTNGIQGENGKSAYEIAVEKGFIGSKDDWLKSLKGIDGAQGASGRDGIDGKSAYEIAVEEGFCGNRNEWLESLKGAEGANGKDGKSAYQLAVEKGYSGSEEEWLASLKGVDGIAGQDGKNGADGKDGVNGLSAYEVAVSQGYSGTAAEWLKSLKGATGQDGKDGEDGKDWIPTEQELNDIADRVILKLPDADNESY